MKRYIIIKVIPAAILLVLVFAGLIRINVINTTTLSPLGNTNENYELVSKEFGDDFSNFIKDNSLVKVYYEDGDDILVKVGNHDFKIMQKSSLVENIKEVFSQIIYKFKSTAQAIGKLI